LLVAYRGFSDSDGTSKPNERQLMHDAVAIFKKGVEISQESKLPLFVLGRSLGGAAAIHVLSLPEFHLSAKGIIL
jgi:predicted alpha/beta hydrolase